jgi:hypothetical protein
MMIRDEHIKIASDDYYFPLANYLLLLPCHQCMFMLSLRSILIHFSWWCQIIVSFLLRLFVNLLRKGKSGGDALTFNIEVRGWVSERDVRVFLSMTGAHGEESCREGAEILGIGIVHPSSSTGPAKRTSPVLGGVVFNKVFGFANEVRASKFGFGKSCPSAERRSRLEATIGAVAISVVEGFSRDGQSAGAT